MKKLLQKYPLILMEGAIIERLRRSSDCSLDPLLVQAPLIYRDGEKQKLAALYESYLFVAQKACLPFVMITPTWRTNHERVMQSDVPKRINIDAVQFLKDIRIKHCDDPEMVKIGGMIGCRNDCYKPEETLSANDAEQFHSWQIEQLVEGGADFLVAETLPCLIEATGIARAMAKTNTEYVISFVIGRNGHLLDGTSLIDAIQHIDNSVSRPPLGYMVNCAYPTFLCAEQQPPELFQRLIAYAANASSLDHDQLDCADSMLCDPVEHWGNEMLKLNREYGMPLLGGCCGTNTEHLEFLTRHRDT